MRSCARISTDTRSSPAEKDNARLRRHSNAERSVAASIDSVLAQTYRAFEVIVVDDGSTDPSRAVLARYEPHVRVLMQANTGAGVARNRGVAEAKGELIAFLDADDLWDSRKLETMARLMVVHPRCVAAYHAVRLIGPTGQTLAESDAKSEYRYSGDALPGLILGRTNNSFSSSRAVVRRAAFIDAGGFPAGIRQAEDFALWLWLAVRGPIRYVVETLGSYRRHETSVSIEPDNELDRAYGRFRGLLGIREDIPRRHDRQLSRLYGDELLFAARTLRGFFRQKGVLAAAAHAYAVAADLAPHNLTLRGLAAWTRLRAPTQRHNRSSGRP